MNGVVRLVKQCECGEPMVVRIHTVIYQSTVEIENVPVLNCECCDRNEVLPEVKSELVGLIGDLGRLPDKQQLSFNDVSEFARLLIEVTANHRMHETAEDIISERINELLDMLLLAQSVEDQLWLDEIRNRLIQLTKYSISLQ